LGKKRRRRSKKTIPLAPTLGIVGGFGDLVTRAMAGEDLQHLLAVATLRATGFNTESGAFEPHHPDGLIRGMGPVIAGLLIHKFVGGWPLNVNRMLASSGIPYVRL